MAEQLFYSATEKVAFYIPKYYVDETAMLDTIIKNLQSEKRKFIKMLGGKKPKETIYSDIIQTSRRYKHMRYFSVKVNKCPKGAFVIGGNEESIQKQISMGYTREQATWTMHKWIHD